MAPPWAATARATARDDYEEALATAWTALQPIVTAEGRVVGYEALLRTRSEAIGSPLEMLDLARRLNRPFELARLARALAADAAQPGADLFVNVAPMDLLDPQLGSADCPLRPIASRVVLEITEQQPVSAVPALQGRLARLRRAGFRVALDDFGSGHATLASWALVRPDVVKIDRGVVTRAAAGEAIARSLLALTVALAHRRRRVVVAEGIETEAQRALCVRLGCDLLQGYLLGRPAPRDAFDDLHAHCA